MLIQLLVGGKTVLDLIEANDNQKKANTVRVDAFEKLSEIQLQLKNQAEKTDMALEKLANRRKSIYEMSIPEFIKIVDILELIEPSEENKKISLEVKTSFKDFSVIKNSHAIHKTDLKNSEAICSYLLFGIGGYSRKKSELQLNQANTMSRNAKAVETHSNNILEFMKYTEEQCENMSNVIVKLNILFIKSLHVLKKIVEVNGEDKLKYNRADREQIRLCFNLIDALKQLTNVNLLENDEVAEEFVQAIAFGEQCLSSIEGNIAALNSFMNK